MTVAVRMLVRGRVQGVGYRFFASQAGRDLGLPGRVRNRDDGTVEIEVAGDAAALETFRARLRQGPAGARVDAIEETTVDASELPSPFRIER